MQELLRGCAASPCCKRLALSLPLTPQLADAAVLIQAPMPPLPMRPAPSEVPSDVASSKRRKGSGTRKRARKPGKEAKSGVLALLTTLSEEGWTQIKVRLEHSEKAQRERRFEEAPHAAESSNSCCVSQQRPVPGICQQPADGAGLPTLNTVSSKPFCAHARPA